jgi:SAM-dependent methyltransferase
MMTLVRAVRWFLTGHGGPGPGPDRGRGWKVWDLDSELRYQPVVAALPQSDLDVCEVGSGPAGLAEWTDRRVVGIDPGSDERHGSVQRPPNMRRLQGDGAHIPLPDRSVAAAVAVDTLEHVPPRIRPAVIEEMKRITASGGRIIIIGPAEAPAARGDRLVLERVTARGDREAIVAWLTEHVENGLPDVQDLITWIGADRVSKITVKGIYNMSLWYTMHRAALEDFPEPRGWHRVHHLTWAPFALLARRVHRGPFYRYLVVAEIDAR